MKVKRIFELSVDEKTTMTKRLYLSFYMGLIMQSIAKLFQVIRPAGYRRVVTLLLFFIVLTFPAVLQAQSQDITPVVGVNVITNGSYYPDYDPALNSTYVNNWSASQYNFNALGWCYF